MAKLIFYSTLILFVSSCIVQKNRAIYSVPENTDEIALSSGFCINDTFGSQTTYIKRALLYNKLQLLKGSDTIMYTTIHGTHGEILLPMLKNSKQKIKQKISKKYKQVAYKYEPIGIYALDSKELKHAVWVFNIQHPKTKDSIIAFDAFTLDRVEIKNKQTLSLFYPTYRYPKKAGVYQKFQKDSIQIGGDRTSNCFPIIQKDTIKVKQKTKSKK